VNRLAHRNARAITIRGLNDDMAALAPLVSAMPTAGASRTARPTPCSDTMRSAGVKIVGLT
jgi:hypothetical protein